MSDKNKNSHQSIPEEIAKNFSVSEKKAMNEIWKTSSSSHQRHKEISDEDIEDALENIHARLGFKNRSDKISGVIRTYSRWVVAAIALLVVASWLFFVPKSVTVPYGEMAEVKLPDGSVVEINSGTDIQYNRFFAFTNRTISLNGEAFFDVAEADIPFIVKSNGAVTEVTGTEFNVRSWSDEPDQQTEVTVAEGEVLFYPDRNHEQLVNLVPGTTSRWNQNLTRPSEPDSINLEQITGWRDQMFIFHEKPLLRIFHDIERRFDLHIDLEAEEAAYETLTGYYGEVQNAESLLDDICMVAGLKYSETSDGYRVYK